MNTSAPRILGKVLCLEHGVSLHELIYLSDKAHISAFSPETGRPVRPHNEIVSSKANDPCLVSLCFRIEPGCFSIELNKELFENFSMKIIDSRFGHRKVSTQLYETNGMHIEACWQIKPEDDSYVIQFGGTQGDSFLVLGIDNTKTIKTNTNVFIKKYFYKNIFELNDYSIGIDPLSDKTRGIFLEKVSLINENIVYDNSTSSYFITDKTANKIKKLSYQDIYNIAIELEVRICEIVSETPITGEIVLEEQNRSFLQFPDVFFKADLNLYFETKNFIGDLWYSLPMIEQYKRTMFLHDHPFIYKDDMILFRDYFIFDIDILCSLFFQGKDQKKQCEIEVEKFISSLYFDKQEVLSKKHLANNKHCIENNPVLYLVNTHIEAINNIIKTSNKPALKRYSNKLSEIGFNTSYEIDGDAIKLSCYALFLYGIKQREIYNLLWRMDTEIQTHDNNSYNSLVSGYANKQAEKISKKYNLPYYKPKDFLKLSKEEQIKFLKEHCD